MASNYSTGHARLVNFVFLVICFSSHEYFVNMDEIINQTKDILSLTTRPFQEARINRKVLCSYCYENTKEIKFFSEEAGLTQHFRVKHRHLTLDGRLLEECKLLFQDLHGQETFSMLQELAKIRREEVS